MDADEIERREFAAAFRGYDRGEVDLYLREVAQEVRGLLKDVSKLKESADQASADLNALKAERAAEKPDEAASSGDKAEAYRRVGEETARVLLAAEAAANEIREAGRHEVTEMVADARRKAQQIVKEAAQGRHEIEEDIKRLKQTRASLAAQLDDIKKRLAEAVAKLQSPVEPPPPLSAKPARTPDKDATPPSGQQPRAAEAAPSKPSRAGEAPAATPRRPEPHAAQPAKTPESPATPARKAETLSEPEIKRGPGEMVESAGEKPDPARTNGAKPTERREEKPVSSPAEPQPEPSDAKTPAPDPVDRLLQEIRNEGAAEAEPISPAPVAVEAPAEPSDSGNVLFDRRAAAVEGLPNEAARRLKRVLQEDQNELLHRIRTQRGKGTLAQNVPDPAEQLTRFNSSLQQVLSRAFAGGRKAAGATGAGKPEGPLSSLIARQVVNPLRAEVEKIVGAGLNAGDTPSAIAERTSDVLRVWKGVRTDLLGEAMVFAAFHQGLLDGWGRRKNVSKKWALSVEERHCPGEVCRKNAGQGALALTTTFASGHLAPPAHGGCTCTLEGT